MTRKFIQNNKVTLIHLDELNTMRIDGPNFYTFDNVRLYRQNHHLFSCISTDDKIHIIWNNVLYMYTLCPYIMDYDIILDPKNNNDFIIACVSVHNKIMFYRNDVMVKMDSISESIKDTINIHIVSEDDCMITFYDNYVPTMNCSFMMFSNTNRVHMDMYIDDIMYLPYIQRFMIKTPLHIYIVNSEGMQVLITNGIEFLHSQIYNENIEDNMVFTCGSCEGYTFNSKEEILIYVHQHHVYVAQTIPPYELQCLGSIKEYNESDYNFSIHYLNYSDIEHILHIECGGKRLSFTL